MKLTQQEKQLLESILAHPSSAGAFSGMVFNAYRDAKMRGINVTIEELIQQALSVRLTAKEMIKQD